MKLKRLEIQGFKSFPDRTVFNFQSDGLTVVVGPNGCGKSNIVDALRWALGEQSAKVLRGATMEDVVFNGSERRKPLGMAEVVLVFDNDGTVEGTWREFSEISVSRKLYRDGTSDYFINGVACRLRDIRELMADAGGTSRGYSIVEQGRISLLVNSKPEEKRALIEEASGILKYRMRRKEAEGKLEKAQQNLLRVGDVIQEVRRQLESLKRGAAKARKYRELRQGLDGHVLRLRFEELGEILRQLRVLEAELQERNGALVEKEAVLGSLEAREQALRLELAGGEGAITALYEETGKVEAEVTRLEADISARGAAVRTLEDRVRALREEEAEILQKGGRDQEEMVQLELQMATILLDFEKGQSDLGDAEALLQQGEEELSGSRKSLEEGRSRAFALGTEKNRLLSEIDSHQRTLDSLGRRSGDVRARMDELKGKADSSSRGLFSREGSLEARRRDREGKREAVEALRKALRGWREELGRLDAELASQSEEVAEKRGLQKTLASLEEQMEGFGEGVRRVLKDYAGRSAQSGVLGVVADNLEVAPEYEAAVLALLGDRLQHVIVDTPENGLSAVGYLKERARGRSGFIPRTPRRDEEGTVPPADGERVIGSLANLVTFREGMQEVGSFLLGNAVLVRDLDQALGLWRANGHHATYVTLEGDIIEPTGVVTGGHLDSGGHDLLARKRKLRELGEELTALEILMSDLKERRETLREEAARGDADLMVRESALQESEREALREESALGVLRAELGHLRQSLEDLAQETSLVEGEMRDNAARLEELKGRLEVATLEESESARNMERQALAFEELTREATIRRARLEEARLAVNTLGLRRENSQRAMEEARARTRERDGRRGRIIAEIGESLNLVTENRAQGERNREAIGRAASLLEEKRAGLTRMKEAQEAFRAEAEDVAARSRNLRAEIAQGKEECSAREIRVHELLAGRENLFARAREEHGRELGEVRREEFPEEPFDRAAWLERIGSLRQKIASLGEVNPGAVEEFEELNTRHDFMIGQKADLEESIASIREAIRRIDQTSREMFLDTFKQVQAKFSEFLPTIYSGSTGEMVLLDEADPLNSGVEINVRPPGKKLRSMQLLSGGEKALVAMALVFSLFLVKPSPFCILDEVDAPLDDENLGHFARIVRELSARFQFLVITHNKLTMEAADVLYGVTMREPGVSQVVSVRLKEVA